MVIFFSKLYLVVTIKICFFNYFVCKQFMEKTFHPCKTNSFKINCRITYVFTEGSNVCGTRPKNTSLDIFSFFHIEIRDNFALILYVFNVHFYISHPFILHKMIFIYLNLQLFFRINMKQQMLFK